MGVGARLKHMDPRARGMFSALPGKAMYCAICAMLAVAAAMGLLATIA